MCRNFLPYFQCGKQFSCILISLCRRVILKKRSLNLAVNCSLSKRDRESRHMMSKQRQINVDATSRRRFDIGTTLFLRCVPIERERGTGLKSANQNQFSYFSTKPCVVGTQNNRLNETVLLSTQNICLN